MPVRVLRKDYGILRKGRFLKMNQGIPINQLPEATAIPPGSMFLVRMGDSTGTKRVKKEVLSEQMEKGMVLGYDETLAFLDADEETGTGEGNGTENSGDNESGVE